MVNAGDGVNPEGMSDEETLKLLRDRLAEILEVAAQYQAYLAIEPHGTFSLTAAGLKPVMALSDSKWLGINYDAANVPRLTDAKGALGAYRWHAYGKPQDEVTTLRAAVNRVVHVHVKDVAGANCVALGRGTVNTISCLRVLKQHGHTGALSLETEGNMEPGGGPAPDRGEPLVRFSRWDALVAAYSTRLWQRLCSWRQATRVGKQAKIDRRFNGETTALARRSRGQCSNDCWGWIAPYPSRWRADSQVNSWDRV